MTPFYYFHFFNLKFPSNEKLAMTSQFDFTRFHNVIICNSVFQPGFLTREFQIPNNDSDMSPKISPEITVRDNFPVKYSQSTKFPTSFKMKCIFLLPDLSEEMLELLYILHS